MTTTQANNSLDRHPAHSSIAPHSEDEEVFALGRNGVVDSTTIQQVRAKNGNPNGEQLTLEQLRDVLSDIGADIEAARRMTSVSIGAINDVCATGCHDIASVLTEHVDNALHLLLERLSVAVHDVSETNAE